MQFTLRTSLFSLCILTGAASAIGADAFSLQRENGVWWFKSPSGDLLWSFGVCCTDLGFAPKDVKSDNPGYSALKLFPDEKSWVQSTASNLRRWGFNSLGGWSDADRFAKYGGSQRLPYFPVLHLGAYDRAPWHDLFAPQMAKAIDGAAKEQILKVRDDPYLVGYFTDNELGWWTDTLFKNYLEMPAESPGHRELLKLVRSHYKNDFSRLRKDWATSAKDFAQLDAKPDLRLKAEGDGIRLVDAWTTKLATRYYSMVRDAVRRYDKKHLIMGDRYCQYYDLPVARASMPYIDAVSTNMGADWTDGGISRFFLDTLHNLAGKPVIVTEFYMTAMENQSGNRNSSGGFPIVQTQRERATAFGKNVSEMAARPYLLGAHWFQFTDEPPKGRGDGEDYNMGLVDIHGKPYDLLTRVSANLNVERRHAQAADVPIANVAPPAIANPMNGLRDWPRQRALVAPSEGTPFGDLYVTWKSDALYVATYAMDYCDESLYEGGKLPEVDRPTLRLKVAGMKSPLIVRYGGKGQKPSVDVAGVEVSEVPGLKHTIVLRIPASLLDRKSLNAGDKIALDGRLSTHSRAELMTWRREIRLTR